MAKLLIAALALIAVAAAEPWIPYPYTYAPTWPAYAGPAYSSAYTIAGPSAAYTGAVAAPAAAYTYAGPGLYNGAYAGPLIADPYYPFLK